MIEGLAKLSMATLGELTDGLVGKAVDQALDAVRRDLLERRRLDSKRGLSIKVDFVPVMDAQGEIAELDICCEVASKLPPASLGTRALVEETGDVQFRSRVPENARQGHLAELSPGSGEVVTAEGEVIKLRANA